MTEINKLIEKACIEYCDQVNSVYNEKDIFKAGANFILHQNRWRKVEEELPDPDIAVLCRMKSPNVIVEGFIYKHNGIAKIETQPDFEFEDYANGEVVEWKPIS